MDFFALSGLFNCLAASGLALLVYFRSPQDPRHRTYALFWSTVGLWSLGYFAWQTANSETLALWFVRFLMAGAIFIPVVFLHHVTILLGEMKKRRSFVKNSYRIGGVFLLANLTPGFVYDVQPALSFPFWPVPGPIFHVFLVWWGGIVLFAHYLLLQGYRSEHGLRRRQYFNLLIASGFGFIGGATNFPLWYGIEILPYGNIWITVFVAWVAYTLLRYHLMDFSVFVESGLSYLAVLLLISQPAYPFLLLAQKSVFGAISLRFSVLQLVVHVLTVAGAYQMRVGTRGAIARTVLRGRELRYRALSQFSTNVAGIQDIDVLGREIINTLSQRTHAETVVLFVLDQNSEKYLPVSGCRTSANTQAHQGFTVTDDLPRYLAIVQSTVIRNDLKNALPDKWKERIIRDLELLQADICVPLLSKNKLLGFYTLGHRVSSSFDLLDDLRLVVTLGREAAMAVENVMLRQEVSRSKALVHQMDRLRSLEAMAGGLAQELHSPLTSIKAFVQLVEMRKNEEEFLSRFRSVISEDVSQIEKLVKEIREYAVPTETRLNSENMNDILVSCLAFISRHPLYRTVNIKKYLEPALPHIVVDRQQVKQVFFNLFLHILNELGKGERTLSVHSQTLTSSTGDRWIQIDISGHCRIDDIDYSIGPNPSPEIVALSDDHRETAERGLDIAKQILDEHHGNIRVERDHASGSLVFSVTLPQSIKEYEMDLSTNDSHSRQLEILEETDLSLRLPHGRLSQ